MCEMHAVVRVGYLVELLLAPLELGLLRHLRCLGELEIRVEGGHAGGSAT